jgi:hypothetical protein
MCGIYGGAALKTISSIDCEGEACYTGQSAGAGGQGGRGGYFNFFPVCTAQGQNFGFSEGISGSRGLVRISW